MLPAYRSQPVVFGLPDIPFVQSECVSLYGLKPPPEHHGSRTVKDHIRTTLFSILGARYKTRITTPELAASSTPVRVLVFRYDAVGDYIVTSPFVRWLAENVPNVEIDVISSTRNIDLIRNDPFVHSVTAIHPGHMPHISWFNVYKHVRNRRPDAVAALVFTKMTKAAVLTALAGPRAMRLTIEHSERKDIYGRVFDIQVQHKQAGAHWMETMAKVGPALFHTGQAEPRPYVVLEQRAQQRVAEMLLTFGVGYSTNPGKGIVAAKGETMQTMSTRGLKYVVLNISAYSPNRQWSAENAVTVAGAIARTLPDTVCFVTGAPSNYPELEVELQRMHVPGTHLWKGSLPELVALIAGAQAVVTPDTAALHMAATAGVPVVGLYAELIKVAEWYPLGTTFRAILSQNPYTINAIPANLVAEQTVQLLS